MSLHYAPIFAKHQQRIEKYEQLSIYDFIEESQEVQPSETVPQVDEAQVVHWEPSTPEELEAYNKACGYPSSALDASILTEDTDSTLFSVGDTVKVRNANDLYSVEDPESYFYLKGFEGKEGIIATKSDTFNSFSVMIDGRGEYFYAKELQKI